MSLLVWDFMILIYLLVWECQEIEISTCIGISVGMEAGIYFSGGVCRIMSLLVRDFRLLRFLLVMGSQWWW